MQLKSKDIWYQIIDKDTWYQIEAKLESNLDPA